MYTRIGIAAALLAVAGCGEKKENSGAGAAEDSKGGQATGDKAGDKAGSGKAIDQAKAEEIAKVQIEGFETQAMPARNTSVTVSFKSNEPAIPDGEKLAITANVGKCQFCQKMDLETWKANPNLKSLLSKSSLEDPDLVYEIDEVDMGGTKAIYTYALAFSSSETEGGGKTRGGVNSYNIFYNNGVNQLHLITGCAGGFFPDTVVDEESYKAYCPPDKQLEAAKKVFAGLAQYL